MDADNGPRRSGSGVEDVPVDRTPIGSVDEDSAGPGWVEPP